MKQLLKEKLLTIIDLSEKEIIDLNYSFVVTYDVDDKETYTEWIDHHKDFKHQLGLNLMDDDIYFPLILTTKKCDLLITLEEVLEILHLGKNKIPLFIKVSIQENRIISLLISKKRRSIKQVEIYSKEDSLFPFSKNLTPSYFDEKKRREGIIRRLFLMFELENRYKTELENNPLNKIDVEIFFGWYFKSFLQFPLHKLPQNTNLSIIIRKSSDKNYSIIDQNQTVILKTKQLKELTKFYIESVLKNEIGGVRVF